MPYNGIFLGSRRWCVFLKLIGSGSTPVRGTMTKVKSTPANGVTVNTAESPDIAGLGRLLTGIGEFPAVVKLLEDQGRELRALRDDIKRLHDGAKNTGGDGWLDTKGAAEYLALSPGTFDKYRYQTQPSIKGYRVGGKTLYKRTDLDAFVMLFEARSGGLA